MSVDERQRHELFLACETTFGSEPADTLMALLPPVGWADVATKNDLAQLEARLDARFETIDARFETIGARFETTEAKFTGELHTALNAQTKTLFFGLATLFTGIAAVVVAVLR